MNRQPYRVRLFWAVSMIIGTIGVVLLVLWLAPDPRLSKTIRIGTPLTDVALSDDAQVVATIDARQRVSVRTLATNKKIALPEGLPCFAEFLAFRPASHELAISYTNGAVILWDTTTQTAIRYLIAVDPTATDPPGSCGTDERGETGREIRLLAFSPSGQFLAASDIRRTFVYDMTTNALVYTFNEFDVFDRDVIGAIAFCPDEAMLAVGVDTDVQLWEMQDGQLVTTLQPPGAAHFIISITFRVQDAALLLARSSVDVEIWSPAEQRMHWHRTFRPGDTNALAFSPDGATVAWGGPANRGFLGGSGFPIIGADDATIYVSSVQAPHLQQELVGHRDLVADLAFSVDGKVLVSASYDGTLRVWKVPRLIND